MSDPQNPIPSEEAPEMTLQAEPTPKEVLALRLRQALYGGLFGSLGATTGWLFWIAIHAFRVNPLEVGLAPVVGAAVGLGNEWFREYRVVARREAAGQPPKPEHEAEKPDEADTAAHYGRAARVWASILLFLGLICEHLVADLIKDVLIPFLSSLTMLFPVGALLAGLIARGRSRAVKSEDVIYYESLASMVGWGFAALCLTGILRVAMGDPHPWAGGGYWVLIGMGLRLTSAPTAPRAAPILGVAAALLLLLGVTTWNVERVVGAAWGSSGPNLIVGVAGIAAVAAGDALNTPDVPARFWNQAENKPSGDTGSKAVEGHDWTALCRWVGCDNVPDPAPTPLKSGVPLQEQFRRDSLEWAHVDQKRTLCRTLHQGWRSQMARSWLVLLLFGVGLSAGAELECHYRPKVYNGSMTRRNDARLALVVLALIAGTILALHFHLHFRHEG